MPEELQEELRRLRAEVRAWRIRIALLALLMLAGFGLIYFYGR